MIWNLETWFANALLLLGFWLVGKKNRWGFAFTCVGEVIWFVASLDRGWWDSAALCGVFALIAGWNLYRWSNAGVA